jgi:hypothetical protein
MTRTEIIRLAVLNSICDDYENLDQIILEDVRKDCSRIGPAVERAEVVQALADLIEDGQAKACLLSPFPPHCVEVEGMPPMEEIEKDFETYLFITDKGMAVHMTADWPFDSEGNLLPGLTVEQEA